MNEDKILEAAKYINKKYTLLNQLNKLQKVRIDPMVIVTKSDSVSQYSEITRLRGLEWVQILCSGIQAELNKVEKDLKNMGVKK